MGEHAIMLSVLKEPQDSWVKLASQQDLIKELADKLLWQAVQGVVPAAQALLMLMTMETTKADSAATIVTLRYSRQDNPGRYPRV